MADAGDNISKKREHEPISIVCLVVLLIATAAVFCVYVNDHYLKDDDETIEYGDSVTLDYTGSLYTYYTDKDGELVPVIFDTSVEKVGTNDSYLFTPNFDSSKSYSNITLTVGNSNYLEMFQNAVIGYDVGDTVKVCIPADKAYSSANLNVSGTTSDKFDFSTVKSMSSDDFKSFFGKDAPTATLTFDYDAIVDSEGKAVEVTATNEGSSISVSYAIVDGEYTVDKGALGKIVMTVSDNAKKYTLSVSDYIAVGDNTVSNKDGTVTVSEIEMLSFDVFQGSTVNIVGFDGTNLVYNSSEGQAVINNMDLYFVIKIVSKN